MKRFYLKAKFSASLKNLKNVVTIVSAFLHGDN